MYTNKQIIIRKMDEFRCLAAENRPDMILLTETWTNDTITNDFLKLQGYEMVGREDRRDTIGGRGGGILVYARKEINCWRDEEENGFNQSISVRVEVEKGIELAVHMIYRSPNSTKRNDEELCKWIKKVKGKCLIIGDINKGRSDARGREFYQVCCITFLEQLVKEATHRSGIILDLVLTNQGEKVREVKTGG